MLNHLLIKKLLLLKMQQQFFLTLYTVSHLLAWKYMCLEQRQATIRVLN